jgi:hypothetical protein
MVYWTNVAIHNLQYPEHVRLEDYLGRDVKSGGYLVIQTDHALGYQRKFLNLQFDPKQWAPICYGSLPNLHRGSNYVLPTAQSDDLRLQVYRRKPHTKD